MSRTVAACTLVLAAVLLTACSPANRELPEFEFSDPRPATADELASAPRVSASNLEWVSQEAKRALASIDERSYAITATAERIGPDVRDLGDGRLEYDVRYSLFISPVDRPDLTVVLHPTGSIDEMGPSIGGLETDLPVVSLIAEMPGEKAYALARYVTQVSKNAEAIEVVPLWESWADMSGDEPPVKKRLLQLAAQRKYSTKDCVWLSYIDPEQEYPGNERAQLLHFDGQSKKWIAFGQRTGSYPAEVEEVR